MADTMADTVPCRGSVHDAIEEGDAELDAMHRALKDSDELPQLPGAAKWWFFDHDMVQNGAKWCQKISKNIDKSWKIIGIPWFYMIFIAIVSYVAIYSLIYYMIFNL